MIAIPLAIIVYLLMGLIFAVPFVFGGKIRPPLGSQILNRSRSNTMQRYHRKRHRVMWAVVLTVVPLLAVVAILKRPTIPTTDPLPVQFEFCQP